MKFFKKGFTLVEVMLFLAISGALVAGIIAATHSTIDQQRYTDSVQNFAEFLRSVYSEVSNPSNSGSGNSKYAIYGKIVTFGEDYTLDYKQNKEQKIFVYDIIGSISNNSISSSSVKWLSSVNANVYIDVTTDGIKKFTFANTPKEYTLKWDAKLKNTNKKQFVGSILIIRSPSSGSVYTYYNENKININQSEKPTVKIPNPLTQDVLNNFKQNQIDFCITPEGYKMNPVQNVRIPTKAHDAASIELIDLDDSSKNKCYDIMI